MKKIKMYVGRREGAKVRRMLKRGIKLIEVIKNYPRLFYKKFREEQLQKFKKEEEELMARPNIQYITYEGAKIPIFDIGVIPYIAETSMSIGLPEIDFQTSVYCGVLLCDEHDDVFLYEITTELMEKGFEKFILKYQTGSERSIEYTLFDGLDWIELKEVDLEIEVKK